MPIIEIKTFINAEVKVVFDLSRSIDLHVESTKHTHEEAIAGKTKGLIDVGETVTWRAKHFGVYQTLTTKITEFDAPYYFVDEMISGAFKCFRHEHHYSSLDGGTLMVDIFDYTSPMGILGRIVDALVLKSYMTELLMRRNETIKACAESGKTECFIGLKTN